MSLDDLLLDLHTVWCGDTAYDPQAWTPENPATGHCAITALIVQALYGGELLRYDMGDQGSHYANFIGQQVVDLTREQFADFDQNAWPVSVRDRDELIQNDDTFSRFTLLAGRLSSLWQNHRRILSLVTPGA